MSNWETIKEKGNVLFKTGSYKEAIDYYNQAIKLKPDEDCLYSNKATCEKCLKQYKLSIKDYNKSLEINPKNTKNIKRLSTVYIILGNFGEASILIQKCINLEPKNYTFKGDLEKINGMINDFSSIQEHKAKEDWAKVEELCEKLLKEATYFTDLKIEYVKVLLTNLKIQKALQLMNELDHDEKANEEFLYLTALAYYYDGTYEKANKFLKILLTKSGNNPKYIDLNKKLKEINDKKDKANKIFKEGKYEEAIEEYTKLLEFDPSNRKFNSIIYANRSLCYQKLKKTTEALKDSNKCLQLNPEYVRGYIKRASVYKELNMFEEAKFDYQKAKELDPSNTEVIGLLEEAKKLESKARKRDYYKILEVDRNASEQEIKKAYRKMAAKYHPDRNSESEETKKMAEKKFIDVNDAYNVLSDPKKKNMYDQGIDPLNPEDQGGMHFGGGGVDLSEIFNMFGGMGGGSSGGTHFTFTTGGGPGGFSFGFPGSSGGSQRGGSRRAGGSSGGFPFEMFFG